MKKILNPILISFLVFVSCHKEALIKQEIVLPCEIQTDNPTGRSYSSDSLISFTCLTKHCGLIPLSAKNYWVYEDSVFNQGDLISVKFDTLRYINTWKSNIDGLVWWQGNITIGLPELLYANDSSIFQLSDRLFIPGIKDVKKEYGLFPGDSIKYLTSFEDAAAMGRSLKIADEIKTPAGTFNDIVYFEKDARYYRKDQVYFKPGIGVVKFIAQKAPMGTYILKPEKVSTLVAFHLE